MASSFESTLPHAVGVETRVAALEADMREVKVGLGRIEVTLARMEERMLPLATKDELALVKQDLARLDGRVSQLPTWWTFLIGMVTINLMTLGGLFTIIRYALPGH